MRRRDGPGGRGAGRPCAYHHGTLRAALIEAGMALPATRPLDDVPLRGMARAVGASAVYRHFPDKRALMEALAGEGLARLAAAQRAASAAAGDGAAGFGATRWRCCAATPPASPLAARIPASSRCAPDRSPTAMLMLDAQAPTNEATGDAVLDAAFAPKPVAGE